MCREGNVLVFQKGGMPLQMSLKRSGKCACKHTDPHSSAKVLMNCINPQSELSLSVDIFNSVLDLFY